ncbi:MAG: hypothetical protein LBO06_04455 [Bacteroidales bacterium]|jgi:hypothetical protein|nr:hypothetical protein [Bacteroidales bacterium]
MKAKTELVKPKKGTMLFNGLYFRQYFKNGKSNPLFAKFSIWNFRLGVFFPSWKTTKLFSKENETSDNNKITK